MSTPPEKNAAITPAASIVIVRDGAAGLEVFMLERNQGAGMAFAGASVFPGGKVDADDRAAHWAANWAANWAGQSPPAAAPEAAYWIAAVRETFEEAGLLLARRPGSRALLGADELQRLVAAGRASEAAGFAGLVQAESLTLAFDQMLHFGHWITPTWAPRRFDTHFFLAAAPHEQRTDLDRRESASGVWVRPAVALADADAGRRTLVAVTRCTLELLATWPTSSEAFAAARNRRVVTVLPVMEETPAGKVLRIPREAGYVRSEMPVNRGG